MKTHVIELKDLDQGRGFFFGLALSLLTLAGFFPLHAQEITGTPGSPSATITIDGRYLPPPPTTFGGEIGLSAKDSKPYWPPQVVPPKGAPNVLLIMTDDQGYGVSGTFGGVPRELLDAWAVRVASEPHYGNIPRAPDEGLGRTGFWQTCRYRTNCKATLRFRPGLPRRRFKSHINRTEFIPEIELMNLR